MTEKDTKELKDRLGETLKRKERAEEDKWFAEQEQKKIERLRRAQRGGSPVGETLAPDASGGSCPRCGKSLVAVKLHGIRVDECPRGHGMWLDQGELEPLAERERDSWLGKYFYRPRIQS